MQKDSRKFFVGTFLSLDKSVIRTQRVCFIVFLTLLTCSWIQAQETPSLPPSPCIESEQLKQFDFWLGHWRVSLADGTFAGENTIRRQQNGCVLIENWRGAQGGSGISMNYFDQAKQQWVQLWTGSEGSQIYIAGGLKNGSMVLVGKLHTLGQEQSADFRGTWTLLDDGRVRQFFEQSTDAGKTWQPWFEGFYTKLERAK